MKNVYNIFKLYDYIVVYVSPCMKIIQVYYIFLRVMLYNILYFS